MTATAQTTPSSAALDLVVCPECGTVAVVEWRDRTGAGGSGGLVKLRCLNRHWFLMPSEVLTEIRTTAPQGRLGSVDVAGLAAV